jgi:hypothetical protein
MARLKCEEKVEEMYNIKNIFYLSERKEKRQKCLAVKITEGVTNVLSAKQNLWTT